MIAMPTTSQLPGVTRDVRDRLARVETKLDQKADKNDITTATLKLVMLGGGALAIVLGVLAKGFGWL